MVRAVRAHQFATMFGPMEGVTDAKEAKTSEAAKGSDDVSDPKQTNINKAMAKLLFQHEQAVMSNARDENFVVECGEKDPFFRRSC